MFKMTQAQLLERRVRELRRKILHTHDKGTREIYKSHINFLQSEKERILCQTK